ncbi:XRE family transcriptional regulator [Mesorhizobium sp. M0808]|uniref:helix-turn-helix domain-containing protein n=1 Tax=Mesorhizobium sp. M0808 TaxID=2957002 RepID=UPI00333516DF
MGELAVCIKENHLKQEEAAKIFHVTRPRISDVVNRETSKFTMDALVSMLRRQTSTPGCRLKAASERHWHLRFMPRLATGARSRRPCLRSVRRSGFAIWSKTPYRRLRC